MPSILVYDYNNYFNRKIKKENTIAAYGASVYSESGTNINFNSNDGINATYVAGKLNNPYEDNGNYLIYSRDNTNITSRWFITESTRTRGGQYQLSLRRDVISDYYDDIISAKSYIQNATLSDDDPLIYTQEPISVNQIKTKEIELKDDTKRAWILAYIARNTSYTNNGADKTDHPHRIHMTTAVIVPDITVDNLESWNYNKYVNTRLYANFVYPYFDFKVMTNQFARGYRNFSYNDAATEDMTTKAGYSVNAIGAFESYMNSKKTEVMNNVNTYSSLYVNKPHNLSDYKSLLYLDGKVLKAADKYYKIKVSNGQELIKRNITSNLSGDYMRTYLNNLFSNASGLGVYKDGSKVDCRFVWDANYVDLTLEEMTYGDYYMDFPEESERLHLKDAPYDLLALPYSDNTNTIIQGTTIKDSKQLYVNIAQELSRLLGSQLYDVQIVPYCPFGGYSMNGTTMTTYTADKRIGKIYNGNSLIAYGVWCTASSGTKNVVLDEPITYTNKKISNQCDMYRLVSPNFNGQFEFSLAKNNTPSLSVFNVDYTYLPYNPYIHMNPKFSGLYGEDFNDARGLICGGDFSLARISDAWENYQLNNKNYQSIFNRQIQNMDVNHKYNMTEQAVGAVAGTLQTAAQGALIGGVYGAAAGAVAGMVGGAADVALSEKRYEESKGYTTDLHNMQLENIRAFPYSLSRTTAYTENNKVFVILEYYTCTEREKEIVANEIANRGMSVGAVGTISDYIFNSWNFKETADRGFIRATPIELEIEGDSHISNTISEELKKGVYFK